MSELDDFIDSQKIIYELKPISENPRLVPLPPASSNEGYSLDDVELKKVHRIPFVKLLNGKEPLNNLKIRHELYLKNWERQKLAINAVLQKTDRFKFRSLRNFLNDSVSDERLITGMLNLGSNISNHDRLLNNVCKYLREDDTICLVKINPNVSFNIQKIIKLIEDHVAYKVHEILHGSISQKRKRKRAGTGSRNKRVKEQEENYDVNDTEDEETAENDFQEGMNLRTEFDLLIGDIERNKYVDIEDMLKIFHEHGLKLIILIQNADAMSSKLIEQTLSLLYKYNRICKIESLIGISTPFIIFQEKIPKILINKLYTKSFSIDNSNEAINQIMEDLLLNINETYNSLIFDPKLVLKFLYKKNTLSIKQFNNYMKLIYMRHYFNQPLSLFWTNDFSKIDLNNIYFEVFKNLPSVIQNSDDFEDDYLKGILNNDLGKIGELLRFNLNKLIDWRYNFRNLIDFLNFLQASILNYNDKKIWMNNLELFQLLFEKYYELRDNDENLNDVEVKTESPRKKKRRSLIKDKNNYKIDPHELLKFLNPILEKLELVSLEEFQSFHKQLLEDKQFKFITSDDDFPKKKLLQFDIKIVTTVIKRCLRNQICDLDLDNQAFSEICVIKDDLVLKIHDSFEPCVRENCLKNLDEPKKVLFNPRHWNNEDKEANGSKNLDSKMFSLIEPILCEMYRIFKETGVNINIFDFYLVFKNSILRRNEVIELLKIKLLNDANFKDEDRKQLLPILNGILAAGEENEDDNPEWDKLTLSWFLKSIAEMQILGLIREGNNKSQNIEKVIWRGI